MSWNPLDYIRDHEIPASYPAPRLYEIFHYDYALMGAYPMRRYLPERSTYSLDILIDPISEREIKKALRQISRDAETYSTTHHYYILEDSNLYLTLISLDSPWVTAALDAARQHLDPSSTEPTLPFEWLLFTKLNYGKRQDYMDCARLIARATPEEISRTKALLEQWLPNALPSLRKLYKVGKEELKRAPKGQRAYVNHQTVYTPWHHMSYAQQVYMNVDWRKLVGHPELDLLTTSAEWATNKVHRSAREEEIINELHAL